MRILNPYLLALVNDNAGQGFETSIVRGRGMEFGG
jgi:hypothetical protein